MPIIRRSTQRDDAMSFVGGFQYSLDQIGESVLLQRTIAAATSGVGELPNGVAHHPITCADKLELKEDGTLTCIHGEVPPNDVRTLACLIHSLAILLIEEGFRFSNLESINMTEPLQQRAVERQLYETIVNIIVDLVAKEFTNDGDARLRIYELIADNFHGLVRSFRKPERATSIEG